MEDFWIEHRYSSCNYTLSRHYEHTYQILFLLSGRIEYQVGEKTYEAGRGGIIVLNALEEHTPTVLEYPYERYIIQINPTLFQNEVRCSEIISIFIKRPADFSHLLHLTDPVWNYSYELILETEKEYLGKRQYWEMYIGADLCRMFITIFRECADILSAMKIGVGTTIAYKVLNYLDHHYVEDVSVNKVASALYMNKHYISHVFKDETGYSLMDYAVSPWMNRAKAMLTEADGSISDIASDCGYTDFAYFSERFKKHTNLPPSKFRKQFYRKENNHGI